VTPVGSGALSSAMKSTRIFPSGSGEGLPRLADAMGNSAPATKISIV